MKNIAKFLTELNRRGALSALMAGMVASVSASLLVRTFLTKREPSGDLTVQIQQVSVALADIGRITEGLKGLKDDLQKTETERARIEADYKRVSELKTVTEEQFLAIRTALSHRTIWQVIGDNLLAFFLGVVSSLAASAIWFYFSRRKE